MDCLQSAPVAVVIQVAQEIIAELPFLLHGHWVEVAIPLALLRRVGIVGVALCSVLCRLGGVLCRSEVPANQVCLEIVGAPVRRLLADDVVLDGGGGNAAHLVRRAAVHECAPEVLRRKAVLHAPAVPTGPVLLLRFLRAQHLERLPYAHIGEVVPFVGSEVACDYWVAPSRWADAEHLHALAAASDLRAVVLGLQAEQGAIRVPSRLGEILPPFARAHFWCYAGLLRLSVVLACLVLSGL